MRPIGRSPASLIIYWNNYPPGILFSLGLGTSEGYQGIPLDPQGPKIWTASRISGPDGRGRRRQVPGGPQQGRHQGLIFEQSCWNKSCFKVSSGFFFRHSSGKWSKWIYRQLSFFKISWVFPKNSWVFPKFLELFQELLSFLRKKVEFSDWPHYFFGFEIKLRLESFEFHESCLNWSLYFS